MKINVCVLRSVLWFIESRDTERGLEEQGEETDQECALSLQCELQLSKRHSLKETAGGRAVLAATAVAHNYSSLSPSYLPQPKKQHKRYRTPKVNLCNMYTHS